MYLVAFLDLAASSQPSQICAHDTDKETKPNPDVKDRAKMPIDAGKVEERFIWDSFENGKPYLGTYRQEISGKIKMHTRKVRPFFHTFVSFS